MRSATAVVLVFALMFVAVPYSQANQLNQSVVIRVNQGKLLNLKNVDRVVVAAPEIADVNVLNRNAIMVIAKKVGQTTVTVWMGQTISTYRVLVVGADIADVSTAIQEALGPSDIHVRVVEDTVILQGTVKSDAEKGAAESVASAFGKRVINLLTLEQPPAPPTSALEEQVRAALKDYPVVVTASGPDTVRIEGVVPTQYDLQKIDMVAKTYAKNVSLLVRVRAPVQVQITTIVAEINRTAMNNLGVEWGGNDPGNPNMLPLLATPGEFNFGYLPGANIALQFLVARLHLLETRNAARTLANPRLVVLEGQTSRLLVGGQVPIPEVGAFGQTTVTFKEFGVRLEFKPVVRPDEPITLDLLTEVSELDFSQAIMTNGFTIPTIRTRRVQTVVSMRPGEYLAIGGLIQRIDSKVISKVPVLGDIPILGALFRSTNFQRGETEMVVFVSPSIVTPTSNQPELPQTPNPDNFNP
jgi:Flp pilus assembly secretin CpaC